ncbi:methyltransferase [Hymenobacter aerilatus]|uniref:tRNA1(Val) (adenine(37)-N6)-methyltransferase n=1 Tax=Hymenobacter aerilatus TaxID=2932251 RepID=A0A8T9SYC9_9BACT|nr:methyltransferase [Hymenobacter aerilatus]UOR07252.1 methyltransferase [Hymenobacter aerilatus]
MANSYFQFKQFRVEQAQCAMKVCTDACVLGAVAAVTGAQRVLDIGTGTGLLALMTAQRNPSATIEAVELDPAAAAQAAENFATSPWAERLRAYPVSLARFAATYPTPYDHILCNPPFFRESLRSPNAQRTTARHTADDTLTFTEISQFAAGFLTEQGTLTVLLPPPEMLYFEQAAAAVGLYPTTRLAVHHRPGSRALRHITAFGRQPQPVITRVLLLHDADDTVYSAEFRKLLSDFYLHL